MGQRRESNDNSIKGPKTGTLFLNLKIVIFLKVFQNTTRLFSFVTMRYHLTSIRKAIIRVPVVEQWSTNPTRNHEVVGSVPALAQWVKDPALLWLWCRPVATAPIQLLAWEPPYAAGAAQEIAKNKIK